MTGKKMIFKCWMLSLEMHEAEMACRIVSSVTLQEMTSSRGDDIGSKLWINCPKILQLCMLKVIFCIGQLRTQNIKKWTLGSTYWVKNPKNWSSVSSIFLLGRGRRIAQTITTVPKPIADTGTMEVLHMFSFLLHLYISLHFLNIFFSLLFSH